MKILVINAGSSSLKYQLFNMENREVLAKGICEKIGNQDASFTLKIPANPSGNIIESPHNLTNHEDAIQLVLDTLVSKKNGVISSMEEIGAVGHRVLHGGEKFSDAVIVTSEVKMAIRECFKFGPLHNPANLKGIEACEAIMTVPQVAVFDTGFHQTMPDYAYMYALPMELYKQDGIRRYGFHGTSHRYVSARCIQWLGGKAEGTRIVTCHLGNGSSIAAIKDGKCLDTTMGLTPLEGILMGTRCGSVDPAVVTSVMRAKNLSPDEMDALMNKNSGMLGLCGTANNRTILARAEEGDKNARLVQTMLCYQLVKYIGGFAAAMGGIDALVFTGGIGENTPLYRTMVAEKLAFLGTAMDEGKNRLRGVETEISVPGSRLRMFVIPTNEELVIAQDTYALVKAR